MGKRTCNTCNSIFGGAWALPGRRQCATCIESELIEAHGPVLRVLVTSAQFSALECSGIFEAPEDDEVLVVDAVHGRELIFPLSRADAITSALIELCNSEDASAEQGDDVACKRLARGAVRSLSNLINRVTAAQVAAGAR